MARKLEFDKDIALQKAMRLFWSKGYEATSLDDLVKAMEINRFSIYNTFGDKKALLLKALEQYQLLVLNHLIAPLREEVPAAQCLSNYLDNVAAQLLTKAGLMGCLVQRTGQGNIIQDDEVKRQMLAMLSSLQDALYEIIKRGQDEGGISKGDASVLTDFVMCHVQGMILLRQTGCKSMSEQVSMLKRMLLNS